MDTHRIFRDLLNTAAQAWSIEDTHTKFTFPCTFFMNKIDFIASRIASVLVIPAIKFGKR